MLVPAVVVRLTAAAEPRVAGRLHDRRAGRVDLHRRRDPDPAGAAVRDRHDRARAGPSASLIVEAGIRGIAVPLTAAAVGGLDRRGAVVHPPGEQGRPAHRIHTRRAGRVRRGGGRRLRRARPRRRRRSPADGCSWSSISSVAVVALLLLRVGLHLALLHEAHDEIHSDEPVLCPHCHHVVPDMAFCPACGVATRASSRSSRNGARRTRPTSDRRTVRRHASRLLRRPQEPTPHRRCGGRRTSGCCGPGASASSWWRSPWSGCR